VCARVVLVGCAARLACLAVDEEQVVQRQEDGLWGGVRGRRSVQRSARATERVSQRQLRSTCALGGHQLPQSGSGARPASGRGGNPRGAYDAGGALRVRQPASQRDDGSSGARMRPLASAHGSGDGAFLAPAARHAPGPRSRGCRPSPRASRAAWRATGAPAPAPRHGLPNACTHARNARNSVADGDGRVATSTLARSAKRFCPTNARRGARARHKGARARAGGGGGAAAGAARHRHACRTKKWARAAKAGAPASGARYAPGAPI
jgi:hypothetical protein